MSNSQGNVYKRSLTNLKSTQKKKIVKITQNNEKFLLLIRMMIARNHRVYHKHKIKRTPVPNTGQRKSFIFLVTQNLPPIQILRKKKTAAKDSIVKQKENPT